ncbi:MAG: tetratricopeptide repeat protein [Phycisphaerae bacterium]|nr:tetratricopeptide repeat protein [Phycisphaerae bacterium]
MKTLLLIAILIFVAPGLSDPAAVFGQEPESVSNDKAADTGESAPGESQMTLEEMIEAAYKAVETAESGGPDEIQDAFARANKLLTTIRLRDPLSVDADFISGRLSLLLGRPREAIGSIDKYAKSRKGENDWLAFKMLGDLYLQARYYRMARDKYRKAADLNPREPDPYAGLSKTELSLARSGRAIEHARRAIELDSRNPPPEREPRYHAVLGEALLGNHKPEEASEAVTKAMEFARERVRSDPTNTELLLKLDAYSELLGKVIGTIIINFPERTEEYARLAHVQIERAEIAHILSLHRILLTIQQGIERSGDNPPAVLILEQAKLLLAVGDPQEAVKVLADLLAGDPGNTEAQQLLEQIRRRQGRTPPGPEREKGQM